MKRLETVLIIVSFVLLGTSMFTNLNTGSAFATAAMTLACFYFYLGFAIFNGISLKAISKKETYDTIPKSNILTGIIVGIAISGAIFSVVFKFMNGAKELAPTFALTSIILLSLVNITSLRQARKGNLNPLYKRVVQRALPYMMIALLTYMMFR
ncbi:MAG: hypothetical protein H6551_05190 [Chitinophagales bacterium]|nr:hypothetical protein [Chitinophagaceae bacterium]MCB9064523.1 hypothetical protein [Chitinophagales bacterium]